MWGAFLILRSTLFFAAVLMCQKLHIYINGYIYVDEVGFAGRDLKLISRSWLPGPRLKPYRISKTCLPGFCLFLFPLLANLLMLQSKVSASGQEHGTDNGYDEVRDGQEHHGPFGLYGGEKEDKSSFQESSQAVPGQIESHLTGEVKESVLFKPFRDLEDEIKLSESEVTRLQVAAEAIIKSEIRPAFRKLLR